MPRSWRAGCTTATANHQIYFVASSEEATKDVYYGREDAGETIRLGNTELSVTSAHPIREWQGSGWPKQERPGPTVFWQGAKGM